MDIDMDMDVDIDIDIDIDIDRDKENETGSSGYTYALSCRPIMQYANISLEYRPTERARSPRSTTRVASNLHPVRA
jgi:hypothetical protein